MNKIENNKYVSRHYKISVNFGLVFYYFNSRTFRLRKGIIPYIIGLFYSILNLFTGFWGFFGFLKKFQGLRNTFNAMYINFTGGEDITKQDLESNFDSYAVYIYNNMERESQKDMSLTDVDIILEIQELYSENYSDYFTADNTSYILENLSKINIDKYDVKNIESVYKAITIYDKYHTN